MHKLVILFALIGTIGSCSENSDSPINNNSTQINNTNNTTLNNNNSNNNTNNNSSPLSVSISAPQAPFKITEGKSISLTGTITGGKEPYTVSWFLNGNKISDNIEDSVVATDPGIRTLSISVTDGNETTATNEIQIEIEDINRTLKPFFGNLHSHSGYSDGEGNADEVLTWARDSVGVDFYVMTDHSEMLFGDEWEEIGQMTDSYNENDVFVTMRGFEWSHPLNGHICVYETDDYNSAYFSPWISFFYEWIEENDGLAQFNHPGRESGVFDDLELDESVRDNFFAIETGNKGTGNTDGEFLPYYIQALDNGWWVAPVSNQDNHSLSMNSHRSVFWASELSRSSLIGAMVSRHFYSSDDPDIEIMFRHGDAIMGDTVTSNTENIEFQVKIQDNEPILRIELITEGGVVADSFEPAENTLKTYWFPSVSSAKKWYFLKVVSYNTLDDEGEIQTAVTAPIWIN